MSYVMYPQDNPDQFKNDFPADLSWFFERNGAWDEYSEFKQLEKLLEIDLEVFDSSTYPYTDDFEPKGLIVDVDTLIETLNRFIYKLKSNPNIDGKILYSVPEESNFNSFIVGGINITDITNIENLNNIDWNNLAAKEHSLYPPANDYINSGALEKDLEQLLFTVKQYKHRGVKNAVLIYL